MTKEPKIIVVTGAESTGKSTLTEELAAYFGVNHYPEFAREYVTNLKESYTFGDVEYIANTQIKQYEEALKPGAPIAFFDTWLVITIIWMEVVFNKKPSWLAEYIRNSKISLFLVCDTDLPWVADPVRENGGEMRETLHKKYIQEIQENSFQYKIIGGTGKQRVQNALSVLKKL